VAVIDSGINYTHEDLAANMWRNPGEVAGNGVDDDDNGAVDDVFGYDSINGDSDPMEDWHHGTHCAGTIGAVGNNGTGVVGVSWKVKLMAIKVLNDKGSGTNAAIASGWEYATVMKRRGVNIRVVNASLGGPSFSQTMKDAIDAAGAAGILNLVAAGNEATNNDATPSYPASYDSPSILAVAASDQNDNVARFSNYGATKVDLAAPGVDIYSTYFPGDGSYASTSGTSMATPMVAGAAALLYAFSPTQTVASMKTLLMETVDPLPQWEGKTVTGGRLNLGRALQVIDPNGLPTVISATPTGVVNTINPKLIVKFNKPVNPASVQSAWSISPAVTGAFAWTNNNQTVTFTPGTALPAGSSYLVRIKGNATSATGVTLDGDASGVSNGTPGDDYTWTFRITGTPNNDMFAAATPLSGDAGLVPGSNVNATRETGEPSHNYGTSGAKSIWYKWTAPALGNVTFSTKGSSYFNVLGVYTGNSVGALGYVTGDSFSDDDNQNECLVTFRAIAGTTYYIAVDGFYFQATEDYPAFTSTGNVLLGWSLDRAPANDFYATATAISGTSGSISGNTIGAYSEPNDDSHYGSSSSVWYKWTAPSTGAVTFDTEGSGFDTELVGFRGATMATADEFTYDRDGGTDSLSQMPFTAIAGTTYNIAVGGNGYGFGGPRGAFKLNWKFVARPANDMFANSVVLSPAAGGKITGNNMGTTLEANEPTPTYSRSGQSIWYKWMAPSDGAVTFDTDGSAIDTHLGVYTGNGLSLLLEVAENDDDSSVSGRLTSKVRFTTVAGTLYYIRIDGPAYGWGEASTTYPLTHGAITVNWSFVAAPANDMFASAATLSGTDGHVNGTTVGASLEVDEENPTYSSGGKSIWYKWTAPFTGAATFDTDGSRNALGNPYNTMLSVYTGTQVNALELITENDDDAQRDPALSSRVRFSAVAGTVYRIRIDNADYASGDNAQSYNKQHGDVTLKWNLIAGPANDLFRNSVVLSPATAGRVVSTTVGASLEAGEENPTYSLGGQSIWYKWTAPRSGQFVVSTAGSTNALGSEYDTYLSVYAGSAVNALQSVDENDNDGNFATSRVTFDAEISTAYYIRVDNSAYHEYDSVRDYDTTHGQVVLQWSLDGAVAQSPIVTGFTPKTGAAGTVVSINGTGLTGATEVRFDGQAGTLRTVSATVVTAAAPAGVRTGKISVVTPRGTAISTANFQVAPTIASFTPTSGAPGTAVTITGTGFTGVTAVTFGGVDAQFRVNSLTQIVATLPAAALTGKIRVTTAAGAGQSTTDFQVPPRITGFSPASGPIGGRVTISGANFIGATSVTFNGVAATAPTITATSISVVIPPGATTGRIAVTTP
ncbi:MAG TPA: S8 family serine peptidase, partial [Abditibacteriaceae bacterium]